MAELVRVTIVANEQEAELARGLLRAEGIDSMHRITDFSFGSGGELPSSGVGPREILVRAEDHELARELLTSLDAD
ncbi:MAG: DUF2007 domain-containing protein [Thermoleophilia bacterium]|nr:DUF2007 domain-containing protein [Thermoleophilia bacterium]